MKVSNKVGSNCFLSVMQMSDSRSTVVRPHAKKPMCRMSLGGPLGNRTNLASEGLQSGSWPMNNEREDL